MPQTTKARSVEEELARLGELTLPELRCKYSDLRGSALPKHVRTGLARLVVAHALQEEWRGGLDRETARKLDRLVATIVPQGAPTPKPRPAKLRVGTRIVREWKGQVFEVLVTRAGFECAGRSYRSLTEIARTITGTNWNGWTFFGVKPAPRTRATGSLANG